MLIGLKKYSAEERNAERKRIHKRGIGIYILFHGILGFGTFAFLIDLGENFLFEHRHIDFEFLAAKALQWVAAGLFFGWFMWRVEYDPDEDEG